MENQASLVKAITILKKKPVERTAADVGELIEATKSIKFFKTLELDEGESVHSDCCKVLQFREYEKGEFIFNYGEPGDSFCIIIQGKVKILVPALRKRPQLLHLNYKPESLQVVETLEAGASFGELALLRGMSRSASIQCIEKTICAILTKLDFAAVIGVIQEKKFNSKLNFLQSLPVFKN